MAWPRGEGTCTYTFEVPDYEFDNYEPSEEKRYLLSKDVPGVSDGEWTCAQPTLAGEDTCPFHTAPAERPDDFDDTRAFLAAIDESASIDDRRRRRRRLQFIGAEFTELDLRGEVVGGADNQYINLTEATVGSLDSVDARIAQPIRFANTTFEGPATFRDCIFEGNAGFRLCKFEEAVTFRGALFTNPTSFKLARFEDEASFWYTTFRQHSLFRLAEFCGQADFKTVDFTDYARFTRATFHDDVDFTLAEFHNDADFIETTFDGDHTFTGATVDRTFDLSDAIVDGQLHLNQMSINDVVMTPQLHASDASCIDLAESTIQGGELGQPPTGDVLYDVTDAELGAVRFTHPDGEPVTDHVRFVGTRYDGFEFESGDMDPQAEGWRIHDVFDQTLLPDERETPPRTVTLRRTYLNAKNGADQAGNNTTAGAFYYREMVYRRRHHRELCGDPSRTVRERLNDLNRLIRNGVLWGTTGYGEKPGRVVITSGIVVGLFAGLYTVLFGSQVSEAPEAVLLSIQSYVTLILGPAPVQSSFLIEALSAIQGFLGAFLVALFVFTFTRRVNR